MVAQVGDQELADVLEHGVADGVPVPIVGRLEVVEVQDHHREPSGEAGPLRAAQLFVEPLLEVAPVPDPGQRVPVGHRPVDLQPAELTLEGGVLPGQPGNLRRFRPGL